jgi:predicted 3-demethylubiquinone-9 3-methyltransferase (glyoxalase superfamily)
MPITKQKITPCLWFDTEAEEAAKFYCAIFKDSRIGAISRYPEAGQEVHHKPAGSVMVVEFEIDGQTFTALNGGPNFRFSEAISLQVHCETQAEVDFFWSKLTQGGGQEGPCGWLKDKYGLSWQVVPAAIPKMMTDPDRAKSARVMNAFMKMKKLDIATLERAYEGKAA